MTVSEYINKFSVEFDTHGVSLRMAGGDETRQQQILEEWKTKGAVSRELGKKFESDIGLLLANNDVSQLEGEYRYTQNIAKVVEKMRSMVPRNSQVHAEQSLKGVIGDEELWGRVDFLHEDEHKTTIIELKYAKLETSNNYNNFLSFLKDFDDCKMYQFVMQLLIYMIIEEKETVNGLLVGLDKLNRNNMFFIEVTKNRGVFSLVDFHFGELNEIKTQEYRTHLEKFIEVFVNETT